MTRLAGHLHRKRGMARPSAWRCSRCDHETSAGRPPPRCPGCGAARLYFLAAPGQPAEPEAARASRWALLEID